MAPKKDKAEEVEAPAADETPDYASKVTVLHEKHAAYIKEQTGVDVDPLAVFLVYSTRVAFRKTSDEYAEVKAAKEQAEKDKEEAKAAAKAEREKAAAEKAEAKAKADAEKAEAKAKREQEAAEKKAAKEAAEAEKKAAKEKADAEKAAASEGDEKPAAKGRRGKGKQTSADAIKDAEKAAGKSPF
jgi:hypothetical protein